MINDKKMTSAEVDAWLYGELSKSGQKAWQKIFGLPKLLRDNPAADCNFKK